MGGVGVNHQPKSENRANVVLALHVQIVRGTRLGTQFVGLGVANTFQPATFGGASNSPASLALLSHCACPITTNSSDRFFLFFFFPDLHNTRQGGHLPNH